MQLLLLEVYKHKRPPVVAGESATVTTQTVMMRTAMQREYVSTDAAIPEALRGQDQRAARLAESRLFLYKVLVKTAETELKRSLY